MPELGFTIEGAEVAKFSATPQIDLKLRLVAGDASETIHSVALRCQVQMEVTRRRYSPQEQEKLLDLFGKPDRWSQTLRNLLWTNVNVNVPPFQASTAVDLPIACTFDFNIAATKYFHALSEGDVPLCVMFSGTIFYSRDDEHMQVTPISWDKEARFSLPVKLWRDMMDSYYPNTAWLCLRRDVFEKLYEYKMRHGIPTWEQAFEQMLRAQMLLEHGREEETVSP